jgi:hypothetical protein
MQSVYLLEVTAEGEKSSLVTMSVLNGHIPNTNNADFACFLVSAFGSEWFTVDGIS